MTDNDQIDILGGDGAEVVLVYPGVPDGEWQAVETGVIAAVDRETGQIIVPFIGPMAAEEVLRMMIGMVKRQEKDVWTDDAGGGA